MKPSSWLIVAILFSSILVVRNQVILSEASLEGDDDIEDQAFKGALGESLTKAESVLGTLQQKIVSKQGNEVTEEDKLSAISESVNAMHEENEKLQNSGLSDDVKDAKSIINESVLSEVENELEKNELFTLEDSDLEAEKMKAKKIIENERKKMNAERKEREQSSDGKDKKYIRSGAKAAIEKELQLQANKLDEEAKLMVESEIQVDQKGQNEGVSAISNSQGDVVEEIENVSSDSSTDGDVLSSLSVDYANGLDKILETDPQTEGDVYKEKSDDYKENEEIQVIKKVTLEIDNENKQVLEKVEELTTKGDEVHEDFLEEKKEVQDMLNKERQEEINKQIHGIASDGKQSDVSSPSSTDNTPINNLPAASEQTGYLFTKEICFTLIIVLAFLILIFGSQFDIFAFFSQRRRTKSFFIQEEDESKRSLLA